MTPPLCIGCHARPVKRPVTRHEPKRGWRIVDGLRWCWYCSRACSCRVQGRRGVADGRAHRNFAASAQTKQQQAIQRRVAEVREDIATLKRYGVPQAIATAMLVRVLTSSEQRGYNRAYSRFVAEPRRKAAA